jgi:tetratricopeptide (TPR) repeat protein
VTSTPVERFAVLPDPGEARTLDDLVERLRLLKVWAGNPSYEAITARINAAWRAAGRPVGELARRGTVVDCFKPGRRRLNTDLFLAVVRALHADAGYLAQWDQALRVVLGETHAAVQVSAQDRLPADLAEFTGRSVELDRLRQLLRRGHETGGAVVLSAIEGMAGVGKTQLAVRAGHVLAAEEPFQQVLFVNLRGFHPDAAQPPADPAAVLDSFLRLLGVPGQQIPYELAARTALFRERLSGRRALVVLDNAAGEEQVRPLLPDSPACLTIVTSRRRLADLHPATHLTVDVFTPDEALDLLKRAVPDLPVGDDPHALERVARRCGYLPLALGLVAGQMRTTSGWTATDHADRLDERHDHRRLETGVELALSLSYQHLPPPRRQLFRLLALHPGQDFDAYAAAALTGTDPDATRAHLYDLGVEHLLVPATAERYGFHDLVRAYATDRAGDEDRPAERRAALTRLLDHYLFAAATAMDTGYPAEPDRRPRIQPSGTPAPALAEPAVARAWLDTERANLTAVTVHAATHGWPEHATRLAATLYRHLDTGGHYTDAVLLHTHAAAAARDSGDAAAEAQALTNLGNAHYRRSAYQQAAGHYRRALALCREIGDRHGEAHALGNLANVEAELGDLHRAAAHYQKAVDLCREIGTQLVQAHALTNLGTIHEQLGDYPQAADCHQQALALCREIGDRTGEAATLGNLGAVYERLGDDTRAADHYQQALDRCREVGYQVGAAYTLTSFGSLHKRAGNHSQAIDCHQQALDLFRDLGDRRGEAETRNNLGSTLSATRRYDQARTQHSAALTLAEQTGGRYEQGRAHHGLADTYHATGDPERARRHWQQALDRYTELGVPEADEVRAALDAERRGSAGVVEPPRTL